MEEAAGRAGPLEFQGWAYFRQAVADATFAVSAQNVSLEGVGLHRVNGGVGEPEVKLEGRRNAQPALVNRSSPA